MDAKVRHGVLGPGGVGGLVGAVLAGAGEDVTLVVRPGTEGRYPKELSLESALGAIRAPVTVAASLRKGLDVLWVAVKAPQLEEALKGVGPGARFGAVVPLLNGVDHVERLRGRFGVEAVVAATIMVESERVAPGRIVHRSPFVRLNVAASGEGRLRAALEAFRRFGFDCKVVEDERTLLWSKLVFLAPVALATTANRSPIGPVAADPEQLARLEASVREACAVATAAGATVDANAVLGIIRGLPPGTRSSMERDVSGGRAPELDAIAGPILRGAAARGIAVPATAHLAEAVRTA